MIAIIIACAAGAITFVSNAEPTARENGWLCLAVGGGILILNRLRRPLSQSIHPGTLLAVGGACLTVISVAADSLNLGSWHGIGSLQLVGAITGAAAIAGGVALRMAGAHSETASSGLVMWLLPRVLAAAIAITIIGIAATKLPVERACPATVPELAESTRGLSTSWFDEDRNVLSCIYNTGGAEL